MQSLFCVWVPGCVCSNCQCCRLSRTTLGRLLICYAPTFFLCVCAFRPYMSDVSRQNGVVRNCFSLLGADEDVRSASFLSRSRSFALSNRRFFRIERSELRETGFSQICTYAMYLVYTNQTHLFCVQEGPSSFTWIDPNPSFLGGINLV